VVDVKKFLQRHDAWWLWDNHKHLALLASGQVSNFYANLSPIYTSPVFHDCVCGFLADLVTGISGRTNVWVIGSAMGGVSLAQGVARELVCRSCVRCAYTEKDSDGGGMTLKRFDLGSQPYVILVEDVVTTGRTTRKTIDGIKEKHPDVTFCKKILCVIDRCGTNFNEFKYCSLLDVEANSWYPVSDDFIGVGLRSSSQIEYEGCTGIRPKDNWALLQEKRDG